MSLPKLLGVLCVWLAVSCATLAQTVAFGGYDAHGRPTTLKVDADITLNLSYTTRGEIASVGDGQALVQVTRNGVGRILRIAANGWLIVEFEYDERGRSKRVYDNFGNELAFIRTPAGVREDVFRHANSAKASAEYLKTVDPLVLGGLATEPAALALALYSLALVERTDVATIGVEPGHRVDRPVTTVRSALQTFVEGFVSTANAATALTCPPRTYLALVAWVQVACKSGAPSSCSSSDSCVVNTVKIARRSNCISARKTVMRKCFGGGNAGHQQQVDQEINGIKECLRVRPQCCKGDEE